MIYHYHALKLFVSLKNIVAPSRILQAPELIETYKDSLSFNKPITKAQAIEILKQYFNEVELKEITNQIEELQAWDTNYGNADKLVEKLSENASQRLINQLIQKKAFESLGYFKSDTPNAVYLCPKLIERSTYNHGIDSNILAEIVYIHECAHYIHYHLNTKDFLKNQNDIDRTDFVECWAQLCTKAWVVKKNKIEYLNAFNTLQKTQAKEYHVFKEFEREEKHIITGFFLNESLTENELWRDTLTSHLNKLIDLKSKNLDNDKGDDFVSVMTNLGICDHETLEPFVKE